MRFVILCLLACSISGCAAVSSAIDEFCGDSRFAVSFGCDIRDEGVKTDG